MAELDLNLILSIWTGSAVPLFLYWLTKRFESGKLVRSAKEKVYRSFLWAISEAVQSLDDFRTLQLLRITNSRSDEEIASAGVKLLSVPSMWVNRDAMETLRSLVPEDGKEKVPKKEQVEAFGELRDLFLVEVQHVVMVNLKRVSKYAQEIGMFELPPSLNHSLAKVFGLLQQKQTAVSTAGLLEMAGLKHLDTGQEVEPWIKEWNATLKELRDELNKDLRSL